MARPEPVQIPSHPLDRFAPLLGAERFPHVEEVAARAREHFRGRTIWHVNSTMRGGGVAEMLGSLLPYVRGAGLDCRWVVLRESDEFFALTKRLHNNLHGNRGDGGPLGEAEARLYARTLAASAAELTPLLHSGDVVFLHDPQTAGLAAAARAAGATVVWRCHIGADRIDAPVQRAQDFLLPHVREADAWVFSRAAYVWAGLDRSRTWTMAPSIDPFSPKSQELEAATVEAILAAIGLGDGRPAVVAAAFTRTDGAPGRVERAAEVIQQQPLPPEAPLLAQVSRWDRLKDPLGVIACLDGDLADRGLHLLLAGPATEAVADDPEGATVWAEVRAALAALPEPTRRLVHLVSLPMDDLDENGAMVNALQRRADVVAQNSLAEGFGLTVAEAMWKRRPVVGTRVGGIQDQIVDGESGVLVDPGEPAQLAAAVAAILDDPARATALGERAHERVRDRFLDATRLAEYAERLLALEAAS